MIRKFITTKAVNRSESRFSLSITGIRRPKPSISGIRSIRCNGASFSTLSFKSGSFFTSFCDASASSSNIDPSGSGIDPSTISNIVSSISANAVEVADAATLPALGSSPTHYVMSMIENIHLFTGLPYWETIIGITVVLRVMLLPIAIKSVLNAARMGALRPDMHKVQEAFKNDPHAAEASVKIKYQKEMQALFVKHKVNPFQAVLMPMIQLPIFISFYFALSKMGDYFPALKTGGAFWFVDLTAPDPLYILPVVNGLSFLMMVEIGADGMQSQENKSQVDFMKQVMRGMGILIVPLTVTVPESVFMYWTANNLFSIVQTLVIQRTGLKKWLGIPDAPVNAPPLKIRSPLESISEAVRMAKEERNQMLKEAATKATDQSSSDASIPPPPPPPSTAQRENPVLNSTPLTDKPTFKVNPKFIKKKAEKNQSAT